MNRIPTPAVQYPESTPAVGARPERALDGAFVSGGLRVLPRAGALVDRTAPQLPPDEMERREHVRRWARMMIVHLERSDFDTRQEGYVPTLERLRDLLDREIERASVVDGA